MRVLMRIMVCLTHVVVSVAQNAITDLATLPDDVRSFVLGNAEITRHTLHLGYDNFSLGIHTST